MPLKQYQSGSLPRRVKILINIEKNLSLGQGKGVIYQPKDVLENYSKYSSEFRAMRDLYESIEQAFGHEYAEAWKNKNHPQKLEEPKCEIEF